VTAVTAVTLMFATVVATAGGEDPAKDVAKKIDAKPDSAKKGEVPKPEKFGVLVNESRAFPGYNLINPGRKHTYLFDNEGRVVHSWTSEHSSGAAAYLLDNGHLFRPAEAVNRKPGFQGPAAAGRIQEFDWDGNLVWEMMATKDGRDKLRSLGYVGSAPAAPADAKKDSPKKDAETKDAGKDDAAKAQSKDAQNQPRSAPLRSTQHPVDPQGNAWRRPLARLQ